MPIRTYLVLLAIGMVWLSGCKKTANDAAVLGFARIYVQLRIASSSMEGHPDKARESRERVLRTAGMDLVAYRQRFKELQSDPEHWDEFWERVQFLADSLENKTLKKGI